MKKIFFRILDLLKPLARVIADYFDIMIYHHAEAIGRYPLIIEDYENSKKNFIPKSVVFNTMCGSIYIGKNTGFGHGVMLLTGKHMGIEEASKTGHELHYVPETGRDIHIGRNCFIGSAALILGNVTIHDYAIVGAGAVVTKDVPAGAFVVGSPAHVVYIQKVPV